MKRLYFIRHGLSELGARGLYAGRTETPLTDVGRTQARQAGLAAKELLIDLIVSSPSKRTLETAHIIAEELSFPKEGILTNEMLIERDLGALETKPYIPGPKNYAKVEGAESDEQLLARAGQALEWLASLQAENLLVVGHSGIGRALRGIVKNSGSMGYRSLQYAKIYQLI